MLSLSQLIPTTPSPRKNRDEKDEGSETTQSDESHRSQLSELPRQESPTQSQEESSHHRNQKSGETQKPSRRGGTNPSTENEPGDDEEQAAYFEKYKDAVEAVYCPPVTAGGSVASQEIVNSGPSLKYLQRVHAAIAPVQPRSFAHFSKLERLQPKMQKVYNKLTKTREHTMESQEEASMRFAREQRKLRNQKIRRRWASRRLHFRKERDFGSALMHRGRRVMTKRFNHEEHLESLRENEIESLNSDESSVVGASRFHETNDSSSESDASENDMDVNKVMEVESDALANLEDKLDHWELGQSAPNWNSLDFQPRQSSTTFATQQSEILRQDPDEETSDQMRVPVSIDRLRQQVKINSRAKQMFLERRKRRYPNYIHHRNLEVMAYRHLTGGIDLGSRREIVQDRLIRSIFSTLRTQRNTPLSRFCSSQVLHRIASQQGANYLVFSKCIVSNPEAGAKYLGLLEDSGVNSFHAGRLKGQQSTLQRLASRRKNFLHRHRVAWNHWTYRDSSNLRAGDGTGTTQGTQHNAGESRASTSATTERDVNLRRTALVDGVAIKSVTAVETQPGEAGTGYAPLFPTESFAHVAGTSPSIPQSPLDPIGITLGPIDRYASYYHQETKINHAFFELVLASLHSRAINKKDTIARCSANRIMYDLLGDYVDITASDSFKLELKKNHGKTQDLPLVQHYRAIRSYCAHQANDQVVIGDALTLALRRESIEREQEEASDCDSQSSAETLGEGSINQVAGDISDFCRTRISHNGLQRFPMLRITYGLSALCQSLPPGAAEILSRPFTADGSSTPLDLFALALEYMEQQSLIKKETSENSGMNDDAVSAGRLEYLVYEAASHFLGAIKSEPLMIENHLWYIGALSACLLLCSGNVIDSVPRRYPSHLAANVSRSRTRSRTKDESVLEHEVRPQLPKFNDIRLELASAIRALIVLVKHQESPRIYEAFVSLLEWQQVIALLAGTNLDSSLPELKELHRHFAVKRLLLENSSVAARHTERWQSNVEVVAMRLESEPGTMENWRRLAYCLGTVGIPSVGRDDNVNKCSCQECELLLPPFVCNRRTRISGTRWWGQSRSWWLESLLQVPREKGHGRASNLGVFLRRLELVVTNMAPAAVGGIQEDSLRVELWNEDESTSAWLPTRSRSQSSPGLREGEMWIAEEREASYTNQLPKRQEDDDSWYRADDLENRNSPSHTGVPALAGRLSGRDEVICYKLLIRCHLLGVDHPSIALGVTNLASLVCGRIDRDKDKDRDSSLDGDDYTDDRFLALKWLCCMGINVPRMLHGRFVRSAS